MNDCCSVPCFVRQSVYHPPDDLRAYLSTSMKNQLQQIKDEQDRLELFYSIHEAGEDAANILPEVMGRVKFSDLDTTLDMFTMGSVLRHCPLVEVLDLSDWIPSAELVTQFTTGLGGTRIKISKLSAHKNTNMTTTGIACLGPLAEGCCVKELDLSWCMLSSDEIHAFSSKVGKAKINTLNLWNNPNMGVKGLKSVGKIVNCCSVRDLDLSWCELSSWEIEAFITQLREPQIKRLSVAGNRNMDLLGISSVAGLMNRLKDAELVMHDCDLLDSEVHGFAKELRHNLGSLDISQDPEPELSADLPAKFTDELCDLVPKVIKSVDVTGLKLGRGVEKFHEKVKILNPDLKILSDSSSETKRLLKKKALKEGVYLHPDQRIRSDHDVFHGGIKKKRKMLAIKALPSTLYHKPRKPHETKREVDVCSTLLGHENVVQYHSHTESGDDTDQRFFIAMELCHHLTLKDLAVKKAVGLDRTETLLHVCGGLRHLHSQSVTHRDLKPGNVLLSRDGKCMKLADFGLSKKFVYEDSISKSNDNIGSEGWGSPEHYMIDGERGKMSTQSDIFSLGLVFYYVLSGGNHAFGKDPEMWRVNIKKDENMDLNGIEGDDVDISKDAIKMMLQREPEDRPCVSEVMAHPLFWKNDRKGRFLCEANRHLQKNSSLSSVLKNIGSSELVLGTKNWSDVLSDCPRIYEKATHVFRKKKKENKEVRKQYKHDSISDLLKFIRNILEHYVEEEPLKKLFTCDEDVWKFFSGKFPKLFCTIYTGIKECRNKWDKDSDFPQDLDKFYTEEAKYNYLSLQDI